LDLALFAALTYPDASGPELDVLTDWYVWSWYTDNFFLDALRDMGPVGGREYARRLAAYMPAEAAITSVPTNAVEAGLADLWARTVPIMSAEWRARFFEVSQRNLQNTLWEVFNRWVPDPIDYFTGAMRAAVGMELATCLLEHALGFEIPSEIDSTRPLRVIREAFGDGVALRNDIFIRHGAHDTNFSHQTARKANGVMVVERFLDCDPQRAVAVVNELATSRTQQFENTALTELPMLFEERSLDLEARVGLLRYVKGLQDWMAGSFQWSTRMNGWGNDAGSPGPTSRCLGGLTGLGTSAAQLGPARQRTATGRRCRGAEHKEASRLLKPTGLGTVAARLGLARRAASVAWPSTSPTGRSEVASRMELPKFFMPYRARCNPHLHTARVHAKAWALEMGLIGTGLPGWDEPGFDRADGSFPMPRARSST
jgi:germacradienol/geosmin synthase